ncbi:MAG TPA: hypothetical protein VE198_16935 [Actinoallomurus sp.]|nr:hypothetical protein [Actinoallomurus sp.]
MVRRAEPRRPGAIRREATGRKANAAVLTLYRLRWDLEEVSGYIEWFRAPHDRSLDTEQAWQELLEAVEHLGDD